PELNAEEINELNSFWEPTPKAGAPRQFDGALQGFARLPNVMPGPILNFDGTSVGNTAPPDTNGDVGPNDYFQSSNSSVRIFDKAGNPRGPAFLMHTLFTGLPAPCGTNDNGDPILLYDRLSNRWVVTQFAFANSAAPPWFECVAISKTPDPTGPYYAYAFQT